MNINELYNTNKNKKTDINEHLPTLFEYAKNKDIVVELGVRDCNSTSAFLAAKPKKLYSIDITPPAEWGFTYFDELSAEANKQIDYIFLNTDSTLVKLNETSIDVLFIDTLHTYDQVTKELNNFKKYNINYILFHDTVLYGIDGYGNNGPEKNNGIKRAINEFIETNTYWKIKEEYYNNNGLLVIENIEYSKNE